MKRLMILIFLWMAISCDRAAFIKALDLPKIDTFRCPNGYAEVDNSLCVMTYEARQGLDARPESRGDIAAWHSVNLQDAHDACNSLNTPAHPYGEYALINNDEWMKIANQIEVIGENWSNGAPYDGCLKRGTAAGWEGGVEVCINTGTAFPVWGPTRTSTIGNLKIASGETIHDFSGNYFEIVDSQVTKWNKPYVWASTYPDWAPVQNEIFEVDTNIGPTFPFSLSSIGPLDTSLRAIDGIGTFNTRTDPSPINPAVLRGGVTWGSAGIYDLYLSRSDDQRESDVSFRCVFRKDP